MKFSLSLSSALTAILVFQGIEAAFNCYMNVNVNSRSCAALSCGITGDYLAGQVVGERPVEGFCTGRRHDRRRWGVLRHAIIEWILRDNSVSRFLLQKPDFCRINRDDAG
ncbi:hypothetical protein B0H17DRAFT_1132032 [Mycena rosella]|uniref:Secreted protein n=1 Tax=Mycena rosella TaxID=1033263 RepID=A0AAD7DLA0_MYCRO|nr:hypothetical protein B0H17DRAFT_1132032 [Mycena rosella]